MNKKYRLVWVVALCIGILLTGCEKIDTNFYNDEKNPNYETLAIAGAVIDVPSAFMQGGDVEYYIRDTYISIQGSDYWIYVQTWNEDLSNNADIATSKQFLEETFSWVPLELKLGEGREYRGEEDYKLIFECETQGYKGYFGYLKNAGNVFYTYSVTNGDNLTSEQCEYITKSLEGLANNTSTAEVGKYKELDKAYKEDANADEPKTLEVNCFSTYRFAE